MTSAHFKLTALLSECDARGIRIAFGGPDCLNIDAPRDALTQDLVALMKAHKSDLLRLIPPGWPSDVAVPDWWPELAGPFEDGFLAEARAVKCRKPECQFDIAVRWPWKDGVNWSCPKCGLASEM